MKLLAIDGNSIINRAFYGIRLLTTKDGRYTNGVYGFINILNKLIELERPDGVAVAFDLPGPTFRHKQYADYKAGRKGMPDELAGQLPLLKEWLTLMGYHCLEARGYEADDILGTLARKAENSGDACVIATGDRDALQLVSPHVRVLLTTTKAGQPMVTDYDEAALRAQYGVSPAGMIEIKALQGDSSDHIPGVLGVGPKTAGELIQQYGSIDYIYDHLDELDIKENLRAKLAAGKQSAYLSRELGTICRSVPIPTSMTDYRNGNRQDGPLRRLMTELEFFNLMKKMDLAPDESLTGQPTEVCAWEPQSERLLAAARVCGVADVMLDAADDGLFVVVDHIIGALKLDDKAGGACAQTLLAEPAIKKRTHDAKRLFHCCMQRGIPLENLSFDTMLAGYLLNPSASGYALGMLVQTYQIRPPQITGEPAVDVSDAAVLPALCRVMEPLIEQNGQRSLLCDVEIPLANVLTHMEMVGFCVDFEGIRKLGETLKQKLAALEARIYDQVGYPFNLNSPRQLGEALFGKLGLPARKKTKNGYSTNAEVLESLREAHPVIEDILEFRQLSKLSATYCEGLQKVAGPDGRIHSTLNQTETRTGRISSTEPNLQNIPVRQPEGRQLRRYFHAAEGYVLCDADYSQIELRVLAHMAEDEAMIRAFQTGADIHTLTASQVFNLPQRLVTPLLRSRAKAVNFGIVYGIGAFSLAKDIGVTRAEAERYINGYFETYPQVAAYMQRVVEQAKRDGYALTMFGRRRYLPELASSNHMLRAFGERVARNMPIQGTAADIIKIAMIRVYRRLREDCPQARLILQVHDELIVEAPQQQSQAVCQILREEMERACTLSVPLTVDIHTGKTWFDTKE